MPLLEVDNLTRRFGGSGERSTGCLKRIASSKTAGGP